MEENKEIPSSADIVAQRLKEQEEGRSGVPFDRAREGAPSEARPKGAETAPAPDTEAPPAPMVTPSTMRINVRFVPVPDQGVILMQLSAPIEVLAMDRNLALTIARDLEKAAKKLPIIVRPGAGVIPSNGHGTGLKAV